MGGGAGHEAIHPRLLSLSVSGFSESIFTLFCESILIIEGSLGPLPVKSSIGKKYNSVKLLEDTWLMNLEA